jgi:hypothetical protein
MGVSFHFILHRFAQLPDAPAFSTLITGSGFIFQYKKNRGTLKINERMSECKKCVND